MNPDEAKSWYTSKGVLGSIGILALGIGHVIGGDYVNGAMEIFTGCLALWGRISASKVIGK